MPVVEEYAQEDEAEYCAQRMSLKSAMYSWGVRTGGGDIVGDVQDTVHDGHGTAASVSHEVSRA